MLIHLIFLALAALSSPASFVFLFCHVQLLILKSLWVTPCSYEYACFIILHGFSPVYRMHTEIYHLVHYNQHNFIPFGIHFPREGHQFVLYITNYTSCFYTYTAFLFWCLSMCECFCRRRLVHALSSPAACVVHCCPHGVHDTEWMYGSVLILRAARLHNQSTSLCSTLSCPCSQSWREIFNVGAEGDNIPVFKKKILTLSGLKCTLIPVCTLQHSSFTFLP